MLKILINCRSRRKPFAPVTLDLTNKMCDFGCFFFLFLSFCNKSLNEKVYHEIRDRPILSKDKKKCFRKEDSASDAVL